METEITAMFAALHQSWKDFKAAPPGKRFQNIHRQRAKQSRGSAVRRWAFITSGTALTLIGIFFLIAPGPGLVILAPGLALIAGESLVVARFLDWAELRLRKLWAWAKAYWRRAGTPTKAILTTLAGFFTLSALAGAYLIFIR